MQCAAALLGHDCKVAREIGLGSGLQVELVQVIHHGAVVAESVCLSGYGVDCHVARTVVGEILLGADGFPGVDVVGLYLVAVGIVVGIPVFFVTSVVAGVIDAVVHCFAVVGGDVGNFLHFATRHLGEPVHPDGIGGVVIHRGDDARQGGSVEGLGHFCGLCDGSRSPCFRSGFLDVGFPFVRQESGFRNLEAAVHYRRL